jgi:digeranylgeranylglycerophospholipid reductase
MQTYHCDIVVVGAGPAGSMTAKVAAENGAKVIVIEEHDQAGVPVYCGEGLSYTGIKDAGLEPVPGLVMQQITKAKVFAPSGRCIELSGEEWTGYIMNREVFDQAIADQAVKAGVTLMTNTTATGVIKENIGILGVNAVHEGEPIQIWAKIIVAADGHASIMRRSAGLERWFNDYVTCAQYQLGGLNIEEPNANEFYVGPDIAPGGYAWVFPKSREVANVGIGVRKTHTKPSIEYLKDFIASDPRFKDAKILKKNGGICPVSGTLDKIVDNGFMLVGDAAGQLIPMTGAGIHCSIEAGKMAAKVAVAAIEEGDVSAERLSEYPKLFEEYWGQRIKASGKVLDMLDKFSTDDLNTLAEVITNKEVMELANGINVTGALARIVARSPLKIIKLIRAYLK